MCSNMYLERLLLEVHFKYIRIKISNLESQMNFYGIYQ